MPPLLTPGLAGRVTSQHSQIEAVCTLSPRSLRPRHPSMQKAVWVVPIRYLMEAGEGTEVDEPSVSFWGVWARRFLDTSLNRVGVWSDFQLCKTDVLGTQV